MAKHIPFVYRKLDSKIANKIFGDSEVVRMPLQAGETVRRSLPKRSKVWVDAAVDRYHWPDAADVAAAKGMEAFTQITGGDKLGRPSFQETPEIEIVDRFVAGVLEKCCELGADWVSVPQLPVVGNSSRNKINRALASATAKWKDKARFKGALILPVIVTHQNQANLKGQRDKHKALARQCFERSGADGYWVVDSSLADWIGSRTFEQRRFKALVSFHEELREGLSSGFSIGGPYWALNLILWARGLVEYPAVGVGARFQYLLPGGTARPPKRRVALSSLRRTAIVSPGLEKWFRGLPRTPELKELRALLKDKHALRLDEAARAQVARFYKGWFDHLASVKPSGRALALFQDFSSAYVLGKSLDDLPSAEKTARRPERLAEQLMFFCMPSS